MRIFRKLAQMLDVDLTTNAPADGDSLTYDSASSKWVPEAVSGGAGGGAPTDVNYLVGTASGDLSAEIVVGTSPGGELGGTWATPTVDATHSGSSHASVQAAAEATAAAALSSHASDTTGIHGIADTSALLDTGDVGATVEAHDADLTTIAGLSPTNDDVLQRKAGSWVNRTMAQLIADLAALGTTFASLASFNDHSARHENGGADEISIAGLDGTPTELTNHLNDTTDAHDASAISVLDTAANFTGTDVEAVLAELQDNIDAGGGGGYTLVDYTEQPNTVAFVGETTIVTSGSFTADGTSKYEIRFYCPLVACFGNTSQIYLREDPAGANTNLGYLVQISDLNTQDSLIVSRILTPSAGSHSYSITAARTSGSGTPQLTAGSGGAGNLVPMYIMITKLA